jgi:hypothetical protein
VPAVLRSISIVLAVVLALVLTASGARADDAADALITRGIELRETGKDDEALVLFRQAYAKAPTPRARAQVALAEQALGLWVNAEADLVGALGETEDPWIAKHRGALEGALAIVRRRLGSLEVRGNEGAEVFLDGVRLGALPAGAFRVEAGTRRLDVRLAGYHASTRTVEVPAAGVARETVTLVPANERASTDGGVEMEPGQAQRVFGYILGGIGVGMLGVGTVGLLVREGQKADYNADPTCPGLGKPQPRTCDERLERIRTLLTVSVSSYVAGGVFIVGGLALVLTAPSARKGPGPASAKGRLPFACAPGASPSEAGVMCAGTF